MQARRRTFDAMIAIDQLIYTTICYIVAQEELLYLPIPSFVPASTKRSRMKPLTCCAPWASRCRTPSA